MGRAKVGVKSVKLGKNEDFCGTMAINKRNMVYHGEDIIIGSLEKVMIEFDEAM